MDISANIIDTGPTLVITEEEPTVEDLVKQVLDSIVDTLAESKKRKHSEIEELPSFSIGIFCGSYGNKRPRLYNKSKKQTIRKIKHPKKVNTPPTILPSEDPKLKHARLFRLLPDLNPYYSHQAILKKVLIEKDPPVFDFTGKRKAHIYIIIPIPKTKRYYMPYLSAYNHIAYFNGSILDWLLHLKEMALMKPPFSQYKSAIKIPPSPPSKIYGPGKYFTRSSVEIFEKNQKVRWAFKRLLNIWLLNKAKQRVTDTDLVTMDPVPKEEQIKVYCIKSRTLYIFAGSSLLKIVKSALETQQGSISSPKLPKNPFTNIPFTSAQLMKITKDLLKWTAKKGKPYPAIIALYQESHYSLNFLTSLHNNYLQYLATKNYVFNDDINGTFFLENLEVLLDTYALFLVPYDRLLDAELFRAWFDESRGDPDRKSVV